MVKLHMTTKPAACLRVSGEDALQFIHNQATADVCGLRPNGSVYSLFLNHQGRVEADATVYLEGPESLLLMSHECPADGLLARFERFIIADDVEVEDLTGQATVVVMNAAAAQAAAVDAADLRLIERRLGPGSVALLGLGTDPVAADGSRQLTAAEAEWERISHGVPAVPRDLDAASTPLAGGVLAAVSFTKGCYLGQEVVARQQRLGRSPQRLVRLRGCGFLEVGMPLEVNGEPAGEVRSVASQGEATIGLALMRSRHAEINHLEVNGKRFEVEPLPSS
jgi:folate-binding protein YgfZ